MTDTTNPTLANFARTYAVTFDWPVIPLQPKGKEPITGHGVKDASADPAQVAAWWGQWPDANIGLHCGGAGLLALDFDVTKPEFAGQDLLQKLLADYPTITSVTGSGGRHLLYRLPQGVTLGDGRGTLPKGIDVKTRGYIVLPPSVHPNGNKYQWLTGCEPLKVNAAPLPAFVLDMLTDRRVRDKQADSPAQPAPLPDDIELLKRIRQSKQGAEFDRLWAGDTSMHGGDQSAADSALCRFLAFWTQHDEAAIDRLFRQSGLMRDKWNRDDYRKRTVEDAIEYTRNKYSPPAPRDQEAIDAAQAAITTQMEDDSATDNQTDNEPVEDDDADEQPNPLGGAGLGAADALDLGWVDEYARLMTRLTGAPFEFHRLCGLVTAATAIQRRAWLPMSFGDIFPNIYAAIIARSSVYHKSSALSKPRALLKRAMLDRLLLSELATSEGLLNQLSGQESGVIIRDEVGTLFASHNTKYLATLKPDLTALYDCYPYSRRLSNQAITVDAPYLNILGATTPTRFYEGVALTDWQDGFLARWLFVMPQGEPDFDAMTGLYTAQHDAELGALAVTLVNIDRQPETPFTLAAGAHKLWDTWQRQAAKDAYLYGDDVVAAIVTRYAAYALKFSMILSAVNGSWGTVTEDTMLTAIRLADSYKTTVGRLLAERNNYGISGAKLQKVFAVIRRKGGDKGATRKVVQQYTKLRANEVAACLDKLLDIGAVVENNRRYMAIADQLPIKTWK